MKRRLCVVFTLLLTLGACERIGKQLGLEDPAKQEARADAEGKAVGGACRQSGRAIEDCYAIYTWLPMESIYAGWREMDEYMRENSLETVTPQLPPPSDPAQRKKKKTSGSGSAEEGDAAPKTSPPAASPAPAPDKTVPAPGATGASAT
ncbi:MAG: hypothetical protein LBO00_00145 [Zoogloeaceae bacterium]|jgi:hypothetical protein|nr:hypothetical protein [Zoogloeaceae bacterium]